RLRNEIDTAVGIGLVRQAHCADTAAKEGPEALSEIGIDCGKSLIKLPPRNFIDLPDRLAGIADRGEEVLALRLQKAESLLSLLKVLESHHVQRPEPGKLSFQFADPGFSGIQSLARERSPGLQLGSQGVGLLVEFFTAQNHMMV